MKRERKRGQLYFCDETRRRAKLFYVVLCSVINILCSVINILNLTKYYRRSVVGYDNEKREKVVRIFRMVREKMNNKEYSLI